LTARPPPAELSVRARWTIVALLALALFINYVDRGAVPTAAPLIQSELALSDGQLGWLFSAFFWSYALLQLPAGWLAERYGAQRVLAVGLIIWACATLLVGFVHSFAALVLLRLMLGIGESAGFPSLSKLLASALPVRSLGKGNGIVAAGYLFGPAAGAFGGGLIMAAYGWRAAFWTFGALSLLWLLPWSQVKMPRSVSTVAAAEAPTLRTLMAQPALWGTALGLFSSNYTFYFMLNWLPSYVVRERGLSISEMATLTGSAYAVTAVSALLAGWAIDRVVSRYDKANLAYKSVMVVAHVGSVACMLCIAVGPPSWAVAGIFAYQVMNGISSPGVFAMSHILAGPAAAGRWVGIQNACGNLAGILAPAITGYLLSRTQHFAAAFMLSAAVSLIGVVGWVWMIPRLAPLKWRSPDSEQAPHAADLQTRVT
jgi:MFS family permease